MAYKDWNIKKKIYIPIIVFFFIGLLIVAFTSFVSVNKIQKKVYQNSAKSLKDIFYEKYQAKKDVGIAGVIPLSTNSVIKKALISGERALALKELTKLNSIYKKYTKFKNIKIHLHTKDLKSFLRVWNLKKYGDYLGDFRKTIVWVKKHQKPIVALEVGRSGLLLRAISPVFYKSEYIGSVEFIQGLNSITRDLAKRHYYVIIVMLNKYKKIAKFIKADYLKNYIIALKDYDKNFLNELKKAEDKDVFVTGNFFVVKIPLSDFNKNIVGYAFVGEKINFIQQVVKESISALLLQVAVISVINLILFLILLFLLQKYIINPIKHLNNGLKSFFEFLSNPKQEIEPIIINTKDEFGEIADFTNKGIKTGSKLHRELFELLQIIDENVIIFEIDENGDIINITKRFCAVSGYEKDELIGKNFMNLVDKDSIASVKKIWLKAQDNNRLRGEIKIVKKDKSVFWMDVVVSKKCEIENECKYVVIGYDITDKKDFENLSKNLEKMVTERTKELEYAKKEVEIAHKSTKESIEFALILQKIFLPEEKEFENYFKDYFIIWKPKDIVGGDIYSLKINDDEALMIVFDCTGHGVPGAFVTMIVKSIEKEVLKDAFYISPAEILSMFNNKLKTLLKQENKEDKSIVGFDGGVIYINRKYKILNYAGSNIPLFYYDGQKVHIIKGTRYSVGYSKCEFNYEYKEEILDIGDDFTFYITTDGFIDQIGGEKELPFGKKRFKKLIEKYANLDLFEQKEKFLKEWEEYKSSYEQVDDITVIGFKI